MENIYNNYDKGIPASLEEVCRIYNETQDSLHYVGLTLNLPRNKKFKLMDSREQTIFLTKIIRESLNQMSKHGIARYKITFEFCKDGVVHAHALIRFDVANSPVGIVQDLPKRIFRNISKYMALQAQPGVYHADYCRYTSPSTVTQLLRTDLELYRWIEYIYKNQPPKSNVVKYVLQTKKENISKEVEQ